MNLILLPGLDGTGDLFAEFASALDPRFDPHVIAYPLDEPASYADIERLVRSRLPADGPFVLLAESFSGPIAISVAADPPPNLCGLVLSCSFARSPRPVMRPLRFLVGAIPGWLLSSWIARKALLGRFGKAALHQILARAIRRVSPRVLRQRLRASAEVDARACLSRIRIPMLYLRATEDRLLPRSAVEEIVVANPAVLVVEIAGPHLLLQARPQECAVAVGRFLLG